MIPDSLRYVLRFTSSTRLYGHEGLSGFWLFFEELIMFCEWLNWQNIIITYIPFKSRSSLRICLLWKFSCWIFAVKLSSSSVNRTQNWKEFREQEDTFKRINYAHNNIYKRFIHTLNLWNGSCSVFFFFFLIWRQPLIRRQQRRRWKAFDDVTNWINPAAVQVCLQSQEWMNWLRKGMEWSSGLHFHGAYLPRSSSSST